MLSKKSENVTVLHQTLKSTVESTPSLLSATSVTMDSVENIRTFVGKKNGNSEANKGGKHVKFPIASHPKGPYKHHLVVRVDTGADVNCMNEKTFNELFPEVQLSVCPNKIQNFGNLVTDISILGQFHTYLEVMG